MDEKHGSILFSYHLPYVEVWVISLHLKTSFLCGAHSKLLSSREREAVRTKEMPMFIFLFLFKLTHQSADVMRFFSMIFGAEIWRGRLEEGGS